MQEASQAGRLPVAEEGFLESAEGGEPATEAGPSSRRLVSAEATYAAELARELQVRSLPRNCARNAGSVSSSPPPPGPLC